MSFSSEKAPYLLTLVFAALGWTTNQIWSDMTTTPIIEANKHSFNSDNNLIGYTITNLSRNEAFDDLTFKIRINADSKATCVGQPLLIPIAPTDLGSSQEVERERPKCESEKYAEYIVPKLHPGAKVQLFIKVSANVNTKLFINSNKPTRLVMSSTETSIIKNRFYVLFWMLVIWSVIMLAYIIFGKSKEH